MSPIRFSAPVFKIGSWTIVRLPKDASTKLPSRGMAMAEGTINKVETRFPLEPDGKGSHWFKVTKEMKVDAGDTATFEIEPMKEWPEPSIPADLKKAVSATPTLLQAWMECTPISHWDWMRWVNSTKNPETRKKRIDVTCSKLKAGERRPCCFNRSMCCEPEVSRSGVLLEPQAQK